jgi:hypothetical protein
MTRRYPVFSIISFKEGKMANGRKKFVWLLSLLISCGILAAGLAVPAGAEGIAANIAYDVCDSAKITKVSYYFKAYKGAERLHMDVSVKNISDATKRFRVNIFLPEGPGGGGLYPRKIKGEVKGVDAGKEHTETFPMYFDKLPTGFTIVVKELG